jgi:hypothetical protein
MLTARLSFANCRVGPWGPSADHAHVIDNRPVLAGVPGPEGAGVTAKFSGRVGVGARLEIRTTGWTAPA